MPSKLIDRSKVKNRGIMPSKLIGPPITRWKEKKKKQKHQYLLYQTKHHSHTVNSQELIFTCSTLYMFNSVRVHSNHM